MDFPQLCPPSPWGQTKRLTGRLIGRFAGRTARPFCGRCGGQSDGGARISSTLTRYAVRNTFGTRRENPKACDCLIHVIRHLKSVPVYVQVPYIPSCIVVQYDVEHAAMSLVAVLPILPVGTSSTKAVWGASGVTQGMYQRGRAPVIQV